MEKPKGYNQEHYADLHIEDQKKWLEYDKYLMNKNKYTKNGFNNA